MKIKRVLFLLVLLPSCVNRFQEKEVYGIYSPVDYKNNYDTIQLRPNEIYYRKVYDKNKKLLLDMKGKWKMSNENRIILNEFYVNLDDDLIKFPELVEDTTGGINTTLEINNGTIRFCGVGHHPDENCYQKIK